MRTPFREVRPYETDGLTDHLRLTPLYSLNGSSRRGDNLISLNVNLSYTREARNRFSDRQVLTCKRQKAIYASRLWFQRRRTAERTALNNITVRVQQNLQWILLTQHFNKRLFYLMVINIQCNGEMSSYNIITCRGLCVTYKTGSELYDWIYYNLYIHITRDYRQYSAITDLHTFQFTVTHAPGFPVFTSRILATDLSQYVTSNHTQSLLVTA
jgi:hypothetical protein